MELLKVVTLGEAKNILDNNFGEYRLEAETVQVSKAAGRYLAEDITAAAPVPSFRRSTMDGYALKSSDISGASDTLPAFLKLKGEVVMGRAAETPVAPGEAVYVPTGAMVPDGADAVVMVEYTELLTADELAVYRPVAVKQHIIEAGDDMKVGDTVLKAGKLLRAADLGVITSAGRSQVRVNRRPVVSVISTGDEIVLPDAEPGPGEVRDINSYTIAAAAEALGCEVSGRIVVRDDETELKRVLSESLGQSDIVLLSGGSSAGKKDYSLSAIASLGGPGIQCHGLAFKPGKPTIIANARGKAVIGLPGHPVSALLVFSILGEYLVRLVNGAEQRVESWVEAILTDNISGAPGRETWQMVRLERTESGYAARPVYGESGLITMLAGAEGSVRIPLNKEGIASGTTVRVYLIEK